MKKNIYEHIRLNQNENIIRGEIYSIEQLEKYAEYMAKNLVVSAEAIDNNILLPRVKQNKSILQLAYKALEEKITSKNSIPQAGEWLIENFHIIEDQIREIQQDLPQGYYNELPRLSLGDLKGYPRVYSISLALIAHSDSNVSKERITKFIQSYQKFSPLKSGELWAVPITLRITLIENLRRLILKLFICEEAKMEINNITKKYLESDMSESNFTKSLNEIFSDQYTHEKASITQLCYNLRDQELDLVHNNISLDKLLKSKKLNIQSAIHAEQLEQSAIQITIGNIITSMRLLSNIDWQDFFEQTSLVESILNKDPSDTYRKMSFKDKDNYRHIIENICKKTKKDELEVSHTLIHMASKAKKEGITHKREFHIGYYLIDSGLEQINQYYNYKKTIYNKIQNTLKGYPTFFYFSLLISLTLMTSIPFVYYLQGQELSFLAMVLIIFLILIPISDVALNISSLIFAKILPPKILPRIDLTEGVPDNAKTFVIIPTIFNDIKMISKMVETLEIQYLTNKDPNIFFALLSDFNDAELKTLNIDKVLLTHLNKLIKELNIKYKIKNENDDIFYAFHRFRCWNPNENTWMGKERKRGKIHEFNKYLKEGLIGDFINPPEHSELFKSIKYVITLDSDTKMLHGAAKKLIGTIIHPLNEPIVDSNKRLVTKGYGILQPNVSVSSESSLSTSFSQLFSDYTGIDPYTTAASNTYQDLFEEAIYTGKGLYVVDTFEEVLKNRVPDNSILSHDLFEGLFLRPALVSNIEFVDDYPTKYKTYSKRLHRWVRGDWQIAKWIFFRIPDSSNRFQKNPLSLISRWKIFDNLRRTLVCSFTLLWLTISWIYFSNNSHVLTLYVVLILFLPPTLHAMTAFCQKEKNLSWLEHIKSNLKAFEKSILQVFITIILLPHHVYTQVDAIIRSLYRQFISKKKLLEWTSAADDQKNHSHKKRLGLDFILVELYSLTLGYYFYVVDNSAWLVAFPFLILWSLSPYVAYSLSKDKEQDTFDLNDEQKIYLRMISRRTWHFYETFLTDEDNWLIPDNFQEIPKPVIAHRTSPTNIGGQLLSIVSAFDMGHITSLERINHLDKSIRSILKLEVTHGHFYNWYDTKTLEPLHPLYISTVDSGNLAAHLIVAKQASADALTSPLIDNKLLQGLTDTLILFKEYLNKLDIERKDSFNLMIDSVLDSIKMNNPENYIQWYELTIFLESEVKAIRRKLYNNNVIILDKEKFQNTIIWNTKVIKTLNSIKEQISQQAPWIGKASNDLTFLIYEYMPEYKLQFKRINNKLNKILNLRDSPKVIKECLIELAVLTEALQGDIRYSERFAELNLIYKESIEKGLRFYKKEIKRVTFLSYQFDNISMSMDFSFLFNKERNIFSIGFNKTDGVLDKSYYDLLASEARVTSFIAIAKGDVPQEHWFSLGRQITVVQKRRVLVSWSASMFEYLMPLLVMRNYKNTILHESHSTAVLAQISYAKENNMPWGVSESAYNAKDLQHQYQYGPFGIPKLGFKYGLGDSKVIAPYATVLAALVNPKEALKNLKRLDSIGCLALYGYYESVDYTKDRLPPSTDSVIIKSFMAHHQSMIYASINNILNENIVQERFHKDPLVQSTNLLLQEKIPRHRLPIQRQPHELSIRSSDNLENLDIRRFNNPIDSFPQTQILSNSEYTVMLTTSGSGVSTSKDMSINRWVEDPVIDNNGQYFYIKDKGTEKFWSPTYQPTLCYPDKYEVAFSENKAEFWRIDSGFLTHTEVIVSPEDNVELRMITITNSSLIEKNISITSYLEPILNTIEEDTAHPSFNKLFIETEFVESKDSLLAKRRKRSKNEKEKWQFHTITIEGEKSSPIEYETSRSSFIGRGNSLQNPKCITENIPLTNKSGVMLDPVMSLRANIVIPPQDYVKVCYSTGIADSRDEILKLINKYQDQYRYSRENELSWAQANMELFHLKITHKNANLYQKLCGLLLMSHTTLRPSSSNITKNKLSQSSLWKFGISGDNPILLLELKQFRDINLLKELLQAHEYYRLKMVKVDLVILHSEESTYRMELKEEILKQIRIFDFESILNKNFGIFVIDSTNFTEEEKLLFYVSARVYIESEKGNLEQQINRLDIRLKNKNIIKTYSKIKSTYKDEKLKKPKLEFSNKFGGFTKNASEYFISLTEDLLPPAPWINVISNSKEFGFFVSEMGSSHTWSGNSRENRLTPWSNDPVSDPSGEAIYIKDEKTGSFWSPTYWPVKKPGEYHAYHGQGYSRFEHNHNGISHDLTYFVPENEPVKVGKLILKNNGNKDRSITITYYVEWVLGFHRSKTSHYLINEKGEQDGVLLSKNPNNSEYSGKIGFAGMNGDITSYTSDRAEFIGYNRNLKSPIAMQYSSLSNNVYSGINSCSVIQTSITLKPKEKKEIIILLGEADNKNQIKNIVNKYFEADKLNNSLNNIKEFWNNHLGKIEVKTPSRDFDILMNRWIPYQVLSCRLWSRTAFYQSGGAYGFRDQLQDSLALLYTDPELSKKYIKNAASHQFVEGDVQHWWHPPGNRGVRTHFSDDLLWLPFVVSKYLGVTSDMNFLEEKISYLEGDQIPQNKEDLYFDASESEIQESLLNHCLKAIDHSFNFGKNGLLLMGGGDWNDGMNNVGILGSGESIWGSEFLLFILNDFIKILDQLNNNGKKKEYILQKNKLIENLKKNSWDGKWYKRAYYDDGSPLGSKDSDECKIDSLSQSWSVFTQFDDASRQIEAMEQVKKNLIDEKNNIVLLFSPPFDKSNKNPGYIKGYPPGVRENGGQYTHAAIWVAMAYNKQKNPDYAKRILKMINPINHSSTFKKANLYKVEPYVIAADVYNHPDHKGRGGWSWYTGSASWFFQAGLELLGIEIHKNKIVINHSTPKEWKQHSIKFTNKSTVYLINFSREVKNKNNQIILNGTKILNNEVPLIDDGSIQTIDINSYQ